jgi:hypothetical protein
MIDMLAVMTTKTTTHRATAPATAPIHLLERTVTTVLITAAVVGFGWVGSMMYLALSG